MKSLESMAEDLINAAYFRGWNAALEKAAQVIRHWQASDISDEGELLDRDDDMMTALLELREKSK